MLIDSVTVVNFRSIKRATLELDEYTVLVGHNGAGKSSFLQALNLFMKPGEKPGTSDYYNRDTDKQINITGTFTELTEEEKESYQSNLDDDGNLVVGRRFPGGEYAGYAYGCPEFEELRELDRKGKPVRKVQVPKLEEMVKSGRFPGLEVVKQKIEDELKRWEEQNPERCEWYLRPGMFDGPPNIAGGGLARRTHFVYVPAVQEASEEAENARGSEYFSDLLDPIVDLVTETEAVRDQFEAAKDEYEEYQELIRESDKKKNFEKDLNQILQRYVSGAQADLRLEPEEMDEPDIDGEIRLMEGGFPAPVSHAGHGLQRTYLLSIVELYQRLQAEEESEAADIVLAIEEPELYQHPTRLRSIHKTFRKLTSREEDSSIRFQTLCTTHHPALIDFGAFDSVRRVFRQPAEAHEAPHLTHVAAADLENIGGKYLYCQGEKGTEPDQSHAAAKLLNIMTGALNEGFFANAVILVEGLEDAGVIYGAAEYHEIDLDGKGISVIPVGGKSKLLYPACVFESLNIPVLILFDMDDHKSGEKRQEGCNKALRKFAGVEGDYSPETDIFENLLHWQYDLKRHLEEQLGQSAWNDAIKEACDYHSLKVSEGRKKYCVKERAVNTILSGGQQLPLLMEFINSAVEEAESAPVAE